MTKPINISCIEKATGKSWTQLVSELDNDGARDLSHSQLASKITEDLDGKIDSHAWWAQSITVAYEQHIGKRIPGQLANGLFEVAVSKTIKASREALFTETVEWFESHTQYLAL